MPRAELPSVFANERDRRAGRAGPFDRALVGRGLGEVFAAALAEPIPDEWRRLAARLDERSRMRAAVRSCG